MRSTLYLSLFLLCGLLGKAFALPFTIAPTGTIPDIIPRGGTVNVAYTVTNNTSNTLNDNYVKYLPTHTSAVSSGCITNFNLAAHGEMGDSCTLTLQVSGDVTGANPNPHQNLFVCMPGGKTCAGTPFPLNISYQSVIAAVGNYESGSFKSAAYYSNDGGINWSTASTLPQALAGTRDQLLAVSCGTTGMLCTAVGYNIVGGVTIPIAFYSNDYGVNWTLATTQPAPVGVASDQLQGVACDSTGLRCATVGFYFTGSTHNGLTHYTTDGGKNWQLATTLPPNTNAQTHILNAIACGSDGLKCTAVGYYFNGSYITNLSYYTTDGGKNWAISTTLPPEPSANPNNLTGVACDSTGAKCTAVGYYSDGSVDYANAYYSSNGGKDWAVATSMPASLGTTIDELKAVTCDSTGLNCIAVGEYTDISAILKPLAYYTNDGGRNWVLATTLPNAVDTYDNVLLGVKCDSTGVNCTTVGMHSSDGTTYHALAYYTLDAGINWTIATTIPADLGTSSYPAAAG